MSLLTTDGVKGLVVIMETFLTVLIGGQENYFLSELFPTEAAQCPEAFLHKFLAHITLFIKYLSLKCI